MWRFKLALEGTCVYVGKNISYAGLFRAQVKKIFVNGRKVINKIMNIVYISIIINY